MAGDSPPRNKIKGDLVDQSRQVGGMAGPGSSAISIRDLLGNGDCGWRCLAGVCHWRAQC